MKIIVHALLILLLTVTAVAGSTFSPGRIDRIGDNLRWGHPTDGLQMSLSSTEPRGSELQVAFRNVGHEDVMLNLGSMLGNGRVQLPDRISINFTDGYGKTRVFEFIDKQHAGVAGRVDDYLVALRVGSIYTLTLTLDQFWCHETKEFAIPLSTGKNSLTAQFVGKGAQLDNGNMSGIALLNFWLGKVESNTLVLER